MWSTRDVYDDGEKTHHVPLFTLFATEQNRNLPKVEPIVVYYPIILKANPAKYLLFNDKLP